VVGVISEICYFFKTGEPYYLIAINGKQKSRRYFASDLEGRCAHATLEQ
jgi:hypothetical protein